MKIRFLGAAGDVTGSAYHVLTKDASILVDCGFFQGRKEEIRLVRRDGSNTPSHRHHARRESCANGFQRIN